MWRNVMAVIGVVWLLFMLRGKDEASAHFDVSALAAGVPLYD